jgi:hypothetical protein
MSDVKTRVRQSAANHPAAADLYERDFYRWSVEQAAALADGNAGELDWENLAEELRSLGNNDKHEIESRLLVLLVHLLKWSMQPSGRKSGWAGTIREQRRRIRRIERSPSLFDYPESVLAEEYADARLVAAGETEIEVDRFPEACPFTMEQILDADFWPDAATK